jgi:hypothetical protein
MSQENVELVGRFHALRSGENLVPLIGEIVEQLGPDRNPRRYLRSGPKIPVGGTCILTSSGMRAQPGKAG